MVGMNEGRGALVQSCLYQHTGFIVLQTSNGKNVKDGTIPAGNLLFFRGGVGGNKKTFNSNLNVLLSQPENFTFCF